MKVFRPQTPVVLISPHLDDVALSCAKFVYSSPGAVVVTPLAGAPSGKHEGWSSRTTGESESPAAQQVRRDEDARAMTLLAARYVWLDLLAREYLHGDPSPTRGQDIKDAIQQTLKECDAVSVVAPLGITHSDHIAVSDACIDIATESDLDWYLYLDMPYAQARPRRMWKRLGAIGERVDLQTFQPFEGDSDMKRQVVLSYASQVLALKSGFGRKFDATITGPEQYWSIRRAS